MPEPKLHKARWVGPYAAELPHGLTLQQGDEYEVTADDLLSEHWEAVGSESKRTERKAEAD